MLTLYLTQGKHFGIKRRFQVFLKEGPRGYKETKRLGKGGKVEAKSYLPYSLWLLFSIEERASLIVSTHFENISLCNDISVFQCSLCL